MVVHFESLLILFKVLSARRLPIVPAELGVAKHPQATQETEEASIDHAEEEGLVSENGNLVIVGQ
jgi:hypothetical protein